MKLLKRNNMKEETLEEAAKNKYPIENTGAMFMPNRHEVSNIFRQEGFIEGANWQAERMYSEEEVLNFTQIILSQYAVGNTNIEQLDLLKETLHIFKNK